MSGIIETWLQRRFQAYLKPNTYRILTAYCHVKHRGKSKFTEEVLEDYIKRTMLPRQQKELLDHFETMTPEEKKRPAGMRE